MTDPYKDNPSTIGYSVHFCQGICVTVQSSIPHTVLLYNQNGSLKSAVGDVTGNIKFPYRWLEEWNIVIECQGIIVFEHTFCPSNKRVLVSLGSRSMGDTIAWLPAIDRFQRKWGCEVIACTFHNHWFENAYPNLQWVKPGVRVDNLYAINTIGWYYHQTDTNRIDDLKVPKDFRQQPLQWTATQALGLSNGEQKPRLSIPIGNRPIEGQYVCIALHSTAQAKYYNRSGGWEEVVSLVIQRGFRVFIASREGDGYMGNQHPSNAERLPNYEIETTATYMRHSAAVIGIGSGLSWLAWALNVPLVLVSGFSKNYSEMQHGVQRVNAPNDVCNGCFNTHKLDASDWNWCPKNKGHRKQFECTKRIEPASILKAFDSALRC